MWVFTEGRFEKKILELIDIGLLRADWDEHEMKWNFAANLPKVVYEDCKKEEIGIVSQIENFGKICASITMKHVKQLLANQ